MDTKNELIALLDALNKLDKESLSSLKAKVNEISKENTFKGSKFDIGDNDGAYFIDTDFECMWIPKENRLFKKLNESHNLCTDREYMEKLAKRFKLQLLVSNFAEIVNDGWKPKWGEAGQIKWYIAKNYSIMNDGSFEYFIFGAHLDRTYGVTYFKSKALAQRCIDEVIIPFKEENGEVL